MNTWTNMVVLAAANSSFQTQFAFLREHTALWWRMWEILGVIGLIILFIIVLVRMHEIKKVRNEIDDAVDEFENTKKQREQTADAHMKS